MSHQRLGGPAAGFPAADKDQATDVFIQDQSAPKGYQTAVKADAKHPAAANGYSPAHYHAHRYRVIDITGSTRFRCPAPTYCEQRMDVAIDMTWNIMNTILTSWLTNPTAATLSSEYRLSMKVSAAPNVMTSRVSMKMGNARTVRSLVNDPYLMCQSEIRRKGTN